MLYMIRYRFAAGTAGRNLERLNMAIHLFATTIFYLTADAVGTDHDGHPYANPDFKKGSVLALDKDGELFAHNITSFSMAGAELTDPASWPRKKNGVVQLYRDNWRYINKAPGAPYYDSIINAPRATLR